MIEDRRRFRIWQQYMVRNLCQPVWDSFCDAAALVDQYAETFPTSAELLTDRRAVAPVSWQPPEWEWVDPTVEQQASQNAIDSFMSDYKTELGIRGKNYKDVFKQCAKEQKMRQGFGLLTGDEQQRAAMVQQTQGQDPAKTSSGNPETESRSASDVQFGTGELANASRLQWNRNLKAIDDVLDRLLASEISLVKAKVLLGMLGLSELSINDLLDEVKNSVAMEKANASDNANVT
jgi:hypothetical protein